MDLSPSRTWMPPPEWLRLTVIESHTGGEPFRVVINGLPEIPGESVLDRRRYASLNLDHLRKALMWEPRGHADMYGGWLGAPTRPDSDIAVLFVHNEGFSTMCGHGIIALTKIVLETGILPSTSPETTIRIDTPAGQVVAIAAIDEGSVRSVSFRNVPSFVTALDQSVVVPGVGNVIYDIAFGGAFYAYVDGKSIGLTLNEAGPLIAAGRAIKDALSGSAALVHPDESDLEFLYGVIFTGDATSPANHSRNVCVFADGEVDRSPTGTGVSGRLAILHTRDQIAVNEQITIESITGSEFNGRVVETQHLGEFEAVVPEITGTAHIIGMSELWIDPTDELNPGFFIR